MKWLLACTKYAVVGAVNLQQPPSETALYRPNATRGDLESCRGPNSTGSSEWDEMWLPGIVSSSSVSHSRSTNSELDGARAVRAREKRHE
ncbi:hypothetical protein THAOC_11927, partial [Thalassiosira oceanica]